MPRPTVTELEPAYYDLSEADLDTEVNAGSFVGLERTTLRTLVGDDVKARVADAGGHSSARDEQVDHAVPLFQVPALEQYTACT